MLNEVGYFFTHFLLVIGICQIEEKETMHEYEMFKN